ncbi:hypothetical protein KGQ20_00375 [Catenulispora sp. NF23]|uniref:Secreted protein n=1 Tax=Catenulispora pinistramenti TaxID=2705254 RepID=A0ABS5KKX3_9ACTN|nr:hypothetical protein [Catenulispora pinistramenti]MBS2531220.1 hypothetical protein [Catenulispora pinistramenti]MBS2546680.1 hypothetical protein [Catenulispora pinistramenti]
MKYVGRKSAALAAAALASLGLAGPAVAAPAADAVTPPSTGQDQLQPVRLVATQATLNLTALDLEDLSAQAMDPVTGQPIRGMLVQFTTADGRFLGQAYTGYDGIADIDAPENVGPGTVQELLSGYYAVLVGDGVHAPTSTHGAITLGTDQQQNVYTQISDRRLKHDLVPVDWSR